MLARYVADRLLAALADRPVVLLHGARQVGKTTLARALAAGDHPARYVSLDLLASLAAAREDPEGFLAGFDGPVVLDEVQRAPDLLLAVKAEVDRDRRPGRFLLTGSANVLFLPRVAETLAGRMEIVTLWPLSQGEIEGRREGFVDAAFSPHKPVLNPPAPTEVGPSLHARLLRGGFPEVGTLRSANRRRA
ncbi:MAG: ATP-binding protein [Planctomycetota bacterium]